MKLIQGSGTATTDTTTACCSSKLSGRTCICSAARKDDRCFKRTALRERNYLIALLSIGKKINWMSKELATFNIMLSQAWLILIIELSKINDLHTKFNRTNHFIRDLSIGRNASNFTSLFLQCAMTLHSA